MRADRAYSCGIVRSPKGAALLANRMTPLALAIGLGLLAALACGSLPPATPTTRPATAAPQVTVIVVTATPAPTTAAIAPTLNSGYTATLTVEPLSSAILAATLPPTQAAEAFVTEVIVNSPPGFTGEEIVGDCWENSLILNRADTWRCTSDNIIYDPCYSIADDPTAVNCDGIRMTLTRPLPPPSLYASQGRTALRIELEDGAICYIIAGMSASFDDQRITYGCSDGWYILGDPVVGDVWTAQKVFVSPDGSAIKDRMEVSIRTVWLG